MIARVTPEITVLVTKVPFRRHHSLPNMVCATYKPQPLNSRVFLVVLLFFFLHLVGFHEEFLWNRTLGVDFQLIFGREASFFHLFCPRSPICILTRLSWEQQPQRLLVPSILVSSRSFFFFGCAVALLSVLAMLCFWFCYVR